MSRGIFVTGTDTGVGKTLVAAGILRHLRNRGLDAVPVKPVQTGVEKAAAGLSVPDLDFSLKVTGLTPEPEELKLMCPYVYEPACSPHLAGKLAGEYPQTRVIKSSVKSLLGTHQAVVVEGAGGIMVPLNENEMMLDLMQTLALPVVLVARPRLGTINHSLLSIQALRRAGLELLGIVFNNTEKPDPEEQFILNDNPWTVARSGDVMVLGNIRHFEGEPDWQQFEGDMTWLNNIYEAVSG